MGGISRVKRDQIELLKKERETKWFELQGVSFTREDSRDAPLSDFQTLLSAPRGELYIVCNELIVEFERNTYRTIDTRFYVSGEIPYVFYAQPCKNPLEERPAIIKEYPDYIITENGYAKTYVAYRFPSHLPEGFLYGVFGLAREIMLTWTKVPNEKILNTLTTSINRKTRIGDASDAAIIANLEELVNRVRAGQDILGFYLYFVVHAPNKASLIDLSNKLQHKLKSFGIEIESPRFFQKNVYNFENRLKVFSLDFFTLKKTFSDTRSMRVLFPLIKETFVDRDGIFIGFSSTGDPIVFNPYNRHNYLMLILGETGSGKSMTTKIYLKRIHEKNSYPIFGVDPENEYINVANYFGSSGVNIHEETPLGLDPLKIGLDRIMTTEILSEVYNVPPQIRPRFRKDFFSSPAKNIFDYIENCDKDLKKYLEPILAPPDRYVFEGNPPDMSRPVIFGLRGLKSNHLKILTTSLISVYFGQSMKQCIIFVDEGWLFTKTPRIMAVFENIARRGRKYGIHFIFVTQRVEDVASKPEGRTLLEQAATTILFRQEKEGADLIKDIYKLSEGELMTLVNASPGEGIFKAGNVKLGLKVVATEKEMEAFSTTPYVARA